MSYFRYKISEQGINTIGAIFWIISDELLSCGKWFPTSISSFPGYEQELSCEVLRVSMVKSIFGKRYFGLKRYFMTPAAPARGPHRRGTILYKKEHINTKTDLGNRNKRFRCDAQIATLRAWKNFRARPIGAAHSRAGCVGVPPARGH